MAGLPIGVQGYYSTEPQSVYASNFLRFYFDKEAFRQTMEKKKQAALAEARKQSQHLSAMQAEQKRQLAELQSRSKQAEDELHARKKALEEKQLHWQQQYGQGFQDSLRLPSVDMPDMNLQKQRALDSMAIQYMLRDTQQLRQYLNTGQEKMQRCRHTLATLDSAYSADTARLGQARRSLNNLQGISEKSVGGLVSSRTDRLFSGFTQLQVGSAQVLIHPYSLNGTAMRGINAGYLFGKVEAEIAAGAIQSVGLLQFDRNRIPFERPAVAFKATTHWSAIKAGMFGHVIRDLPGRAAKNGTDAFSNQVFGVFAEGALSKHTSIELSAATAAFSVQSSRVRQVIYSGPASVKRRGLHNKAYRLRLEQQLGKGISAELIAQMAGPGFRNLGNPFMRSRFEEQAFKLKGAVFSGQLLLSGFYKRFNDNPGKMQEITNASQGYGFSMQTRFKKRSMPNFSFSITPYEQGNNHPDTLLRVNSRFNMKMAGVSWRLQRGGFNYSLHAMGTQSTMALTDTQRISMNTLTIQQDLQAGKGFSAGVTGTFNRSSPAVDSTQSDIWQARLGWSGAIGQFSLQGHYAQFLNGAYRKGIGLVYGKPVGKNLRLSLKVNYDHYYRMWNLGRQVAWGGMFRAEIRW